jgi:hypothetical protein
MAAIRRPLTETEWAAVKAALPANQSFAFIHEIERIKECCWNCEQYNGFEGSPGRCLLHNSPIPNDHRGKAQECFQIRVIPF